MKKSIYTFTSMIVIFTLIIFGYLYLCQKLENDVIWVDYKINDINIKGMTVQEARDEIQNKYNDDYRESLYKITLADQTYDVNVFPALSLDAEEYIEAAYLAGHREWFKRGLDYYRVLKNTTDTPDIHLAPELSDPQCILEQIDASEIEKVNTASETVCILKDGYISVHKGKDGVRADFDSLMDMISNSLYEGKFNKTFECPIIEVKKQDIDLEPYYQKIRKLKVESILDPKNPLKALPSQAGISLDLDAAMKIYEEAEEGAYLMIPFEIDEPEVSQKEMQSRIFRDELSYIEVAGGGSESRMANITLACNFCNDTILMPGDVFSYNDTVGQRTTERGFRVAGVYSSGQVTQGVGGGICQVSSSIYDAALYADLEIVERRNHSLTVSYLPLGMDATVDWGTQDFKFKNNTKYPVKLKVVYENGVVKVTVLGTRLEDQTVEIINEKTGGLSCITYRNVYDSKGNLIKEEQVSKSSYMGAH